MGRRTRGLYRRRQYFYFKYKTPDGRWEEHATRTSNYRDAQLAKAAFLREVQEGLLPNDRSRWTLQEASEEWLRIRGSRVARGTFLSEKTITRNLLRVLGESAVLAKIADIHVLNRYESSRLDEGASPKTVNNEVLVLTSILRGANLWHRVMGYKPLKVRKTDIGTALTGDESSRLIEYAKLAAPHAVAPNVALASFATGMRSGEINKLQLGSINLRAPNPYLYVKRSTTKSDKGARYVALDKMACWALRNLIARAQFLGATAPEHYLLPTLRERHTRVTDPLHGGRGFDPDHPQSSWSKEWNQLRRSVRIQHRRFHDLRHTYITRAAEAGVPIAVTQAQVGHMCAQMVDHYTHICQAAIHSAAKAIEERSSKLLVQLGIVTESEEIDDKSQSTTDSAQ